MVDLITNSSSELFMLETGKTARTVKSMITHLATIWRGENIDPWTNGYLGRRIRIFDINWNPPKEAVSAYRQVLDSNAHTPLQEEIRVLNMYIHNGWRQPIPDPDDPPPHRFEPPSDYDGTDLDTWIQMKTARCYRGLQDALRPMLDYIQQWHPAITEDQATLICLNRNYSDLEHMHPAYIQARIQAPDGGSRWTRFQENEDAQSAFTDRLDTLGMGDTISGWMMYHMANPMVGRHAYFTSAEDNSVPGTLMEFICNNIPGTKTWHLG